MDEIHTLYEQLIVLDENGDKDIDPRVRACIFKKIIEQLNSLRRDIEEVPFGSKEYVEMDEKIRRLLLTEIQIILDDYEIKKQKGKLKDWQEMYGDVKYYRDLYYYYRFNGKDRVLKDYRLLY